MKNNEALFEYCLRLGDNSLILGHRLSELCGHGPILEEDIALTNIALDLIGQSRMFLQYACEVENKGRTEDDLAYKRHEQDYRNTFLVEQPNGHFGMTIARQFLVDVFNYYFYTELCNSTDKQLVAIAQKSIKEVTYHLRHSTDWVLRLGDGTTESHEKIQEAFNELWSFTFDLFNEMPDDKQLIDGGVIPDMNGIKSKWEAKVKEVFLEATLTLPEGKRYGLGNSRRGNHTEYLGFILAEMQHLPRMYPDAVW